MVTLLELSETAPATSGLAKLKEVRTFAEDFGLLTKNVIALATTESPPSYFVSILAV